MSVFSPTRSCVPDSPDIFLIQPADLPAPHKRRRWGQLYGAAAGLALAEAAATAAGPVVVLARSALEADRIEQEIGFFADNSLPVLHFPDWETLAYDAFSPHQDIISQRLEVLYRLPRSDPRRRGRCGGHTDAAAASGQLRGVRVADAGGR